MVRQINEKGGLLGRKLTMISKDDESTPAVGVSRANEMISEKADLVIEGWNSPVTLAMQPILARGKHHGHHRRLQIGSDPQRRNQSLRVRINSSNGFDAAVIAKYVVETIKAKKVAFLTERRLGNGFQSGRGGRIQEAEFLRQVDMTQKFAFKDTDFSVQLTNLKGANPDAIIVTNSSNSSGLPAMVEQYRQADIELDFVGAVGIM